MPKKVIVEKVIAEVIEEEDCDSYKRDSSRPLGSAMAGDLVVGEAPGLSLGMNFEALAAALSNAAHNAANTHHSTQVALHASTCLAVVKLYSQPERGHRPKRSLHSPNAATRRDSPVRR